MKINRTSKFNVDPQVQRFFTEVAIQINLLSEGRQAGRYAALAAPPTTGEWAQGDTVDNSAPVELGTAPNRYVIDGWRCVAGGTPGTWVQRRSLTGN